MADELIGPAFGLVAVHVTQEDHPLVAAQHGFHFVGQGQGLVQIPLRQHAGVDDQVALLVDGQGPVAQPVDELLAVGGIEDVIQGIVAMRGSDTAGHGQQVQVVIAQNSPGALAHLHHGAQGLQGLGAAVDEVAGEDELLLVFFRNIGQQALQRRIASLQVTDDVDTRIRTSVAVHHFIERGASGIDRNQS
ncbi:hypothetical protein GWL_46310 [Herbaspirillum sp. GW103]|nr:hypothetical protein GWL_46310 [Herbaspirillum sp. GW103]